MPNASEVIGARIKARRLELELTVEQLANLLNVSRQAVHHWEAGDSTPHLDRQTFVAEVLDVSWASLFSPEDAA